MESQKLEENLEGHVLFESVARKVERIIKSFSPAAKVSAMLSETAKTAGKSVLFASAYKQAKKLQGLITKDLERYGYKNNPEEIIYVAFQILEKNGELTPEEAEFVRNNYITIKRLILGRSRENKKTQEQKGGERIEAVYNAVKQLAATVLEKKKKPEEEKQETAPRTPDKMSEFDLLDLDVFDLAELRNIDPMKFYKTFSGNDNSYRAPVARAEHYRRIFGIDKDAPDEVIEKTFSETQNKFLGRMNGLWEQILKMFHKKEANVEKGKFKGKAKDAKSIFELYEILNKLETSTNLTERELEEIDQARVKLTLYLRAAKIRLSPQYRLRHSIKAYMDKYLTRNIFRSLEQVEIPVPISGSVETEKMASLAIKVWKAELIDPDSDETVPVYIYIGGDSEHPEKGKSGIVNLKSMAKAVLKSLATRKDPDDLFRMTVMPALERPEDLQKTRDILAKTILHPQSVVKDENENGASAYKERNVKPVVTIVVPSIMKDGKLMRGFIEDAKNNNEPVRLSSFKVEVRTGPAREVVSEHHPFDNANHGVYRIIRMLPAFNLLRNPKRYQENWIGRAVQMFDSMEEQIRQEGTDTLPTWVRHKFMKGYHSILNHKSRASSRLSLT